MRAIDADAFSKEWEGRIYEGDVKTLLDSAPTIEPERKTGKWIRNDNGTWSCDQCNSWIPDEQHYYARFCLYCGAKMKVKQ